jgi:hypothetical protein
VEEPSKVKTLLEFFAAYFDFLYLDARYRITDSTTSGVATIDAGLNLTGPAISWSIANNRGQIHIAVAPTRLAQSRDRWFRVSLVRQYLDDYDETNRVSPPETVRWIRDNLDRVEELLIGENADHSFEELNALAEALSIKYFGPVKSRRDLAD